MAAITDPGSAMAAITYPAGSVIDGIGYRVTDPVSLKVPELKRWLQRRRAATKGRKADLIAR